MITVIVPIYNTEKYLEDCILSIVEQSYQDLEILLIDDCSTDASGTIIDRWAEHDVRIQAIHNKTNSGVSFSRNVGLIEAHGEYLSFVDSDDYIDRSMYERLLAVMDAQKADLVVFPWKVVTNKGRIIEPEIEFEDGFDCSGEEALNFFLPAIGKGKLNMLACNRLIRRSLIENEDGSILLFDTALNYSEDALWQAEVIPRAGRVAYCGEALYYYRLAREGNSNMERMTTTKYCVSAIMSYRMIYERLEARQLVCAKNAYQRSLHHRLLGMRAALECGDQEVFRHCRRGFLNDLFQWTKMEKSMYGLKWSLRKSIQYVLLCAGLIRFFPV